MVAIGEVLVGWLLERVADDSFRNSAWFAGDGRDRIVCGWRNRATYMQTWNWKGERMRMLRDLLSRLLGYGMEVIRGQATLSA